MKIYPNGGDESAWRDPCEAMKDLEDDTTVHHDQMKVAAS